MHAMELIQVVVVYFLWLNEIEWNNIRNYKSRNISEVYIILYHNSFPLRKQKFTYNCIPLRHLWINMYWNKPCEMLVQCHEHLLSISVKRISKEWNYSSLLFIETQYCVTHTCMTYDLCRKVWNKNVDITFSAHGALPSSGTLKIKRLQANWIYS
jgi:hypothetical protein